MSMTMIDEQVRKRPQRSRLVAVVLALLVAVGVSVAAPPIVPSAQAATESAGYDSAGGFLGAYRIGSNYVFCVDIGAASPTNVGASYVTATSVNNASAAAHRRASYAVWRYNNMTSRAGNNNWAAATALYVWSLLDPTEFNMNRGGFSGVDYFITRAPAGQRADIRNKYNTLVTQGQAIGNVGSTNPFVELEVNEDYSGFLHLRGAAGWVATVTVSGARRSSDNATTFEMTGGQSVAITADAPDDPTVKYEVEVTGQATGWRNEVRLHRVSGQQRLISSGGPTIVPLYDFTDDPLGTDFAPVLTTRVSDRVLQAGDELVDIVSFAVSDPETMLWKRYLADPADPDSELLYYQIRARGTVYGPFDTEPEQSTTVPAGAPVAGTATITTSETDGPTVEYQASGGTASGPGYYVWVWTIDANDQDGISPSVSPYVPADYYFQDDFGIAQETSIVPFSPEAITQISTARVAGGVEVCDAVTVTSDTWLNEAGGAPIPVTFTATLYGDTEQITQRASAPGSATALATLFFQATEPGEHTVCTTLPVELDPEIVGVTWVIAVDGPEQIGLYREAITAWQSDYGIPEESATVEPAAYSTTATQETFYGDPAWDTLHVDGVVAPNTTVKFEAFWRGSPTATVPSCTDDLRVFESDLVEVPAGYQQAVSVRGPETVFENLGLHDWVAIVEVDGIEVWRGDCGDPAEVTLAKAGWTSLLETGPTSHDDQVAQHGPWIAGGLILGGTALLVVQWVRRRKEAL